MFGLVPLHLALVPETFLINPRQHLPCPKTIYFLYIHTYTYIRTYTYIHTYTYMHTYIHSYIHTYIYIHTMKSQPWICLDAMLVYPTLILNCILTNIFFPLGKVIGMVRSRTSFILSSRSWEIGSPLTGGAGRMKYACVVPASVIHI